jgi:osmotically-inducible protein OsmY
MIRLDSQIKTDIINALNFEPGIASPNIIVNVEDGLVTLTGTVEFFYEKPLVEKIVKGVQGVKGLVEELQINFNESLMRSDQDIAQAAIRALEWDSSIPAHKVKVVVEHGVVKLSGELEWQYQRDRAYNAVKYLFGIKDIQNNIALHIHRLGGF